MKIRDGSTQNYFLKSNFNPHTATMLYHLSFLKALDLEKVKLNYKFVMGTLIYFVLKYSQHTTLAFYCFMEYTITRNTHQIHRNS